MRVIHQDLRLSSQLVDILVWVKLDVLVELLNVLLKPMKSFRRNEKPH